ncbi:hypothetical protein diail_11746 [Diaporthe ilicicola]|nr:hypothetical protein diail_11746 [Diaporthe ilicicola]
MATPAPTDNADIKSANDETNGETNNDEDGGPFPLTAQEQLQAQALRREQAVGFKLQINHCRLALKYSVVGWAGTLEQDKIPSTLARAPSIRNLDARLDRLERALTPFLPRQGGGGGGAGQGQGLGQGLGAEALQRAEGVRERLLGIELGTKSTKVIIPVLDAIERDARAARVLPPQDRKGWAWSWVFDDWFRWCGEACAWVSATHGTTVEFLV